MFPLFLITVRQLLIFVCFSSLLKAQVFDTIDHRKRLHYLSDNKLQTAQDTLINSLVKSYMQSPYNCGISIAFRKNEQNHFYNYGETARNSNTASTVNSVYELGSMSSTFTGLLLAKALTEKKLTLEDDIRDYLPGKYPNLIFYGKVIRIKHLINHCAALPLFPANMKTQVDYDSLNPYKNYSKEMVLAYLKTIQLSSEPGAAYHYSAMGIAMLGMILENIYKLSFDALVEQKILKPLDLSTTGLHLTEAQMALLTKGYNKNGNATPHWDLNLFAAAAGLNSSSQDVLTYLNYNLQEPDTACRLAHQISQVNGEKMAYGWFVKKTKQGNTMYWHSAATFGYTGFSAFMKEKNCSLVVLANSATNVEYIAIALLNYLQK